MLLMILALILLQLDATAVPGPHCAITGYYCCSWPFFVQQLDAAAVPDPRHAAAGCYYCSWPLSCSSWMLLQFLFLVVQQLDVTALPGPPS